MGQRVIWYLVGYTLDMLVWNGSSSAGSSLRSGLGVDTHGGGLCGVTTLSGVSNRIYLRVPPRSQDGLEGL